MGNLFSWKFVCEWFQVHSAASARNGARSGAPSSDLSRLAALEHCGAAALMASFWILRNWLLQFSIIYAYLWPRLPPWHDKFKWQTAGGALVEHGGCDLITIQPTVLF
jgi:hypothetical protein